MQNRFQYLVFIFILFSATVFSQPCLQGYLYRVPVKISNTSQDTSGVVEIVFNAASLINSGKIQSSLADLRFVDGDENILEYWVDEQNTKTSRQKAWVRVPNILNGTTTIYMFYGNFSAVSSATTSIFTLFDGFDGSLINTNNWQGTCSGTATVSNGQVHLSNNTVLRSKNTFNRNYAITAYISSKTGADSVASIGQANASDNGYAISFNSHNTNFELRNVANYSACPRPIARQVGAPGSAEGVWNFQWATDNQVKISGPDMIAEISSNVAGITSSDLTYFFMSVNNTGSLSVDWVHMRLLHGQELTTSLEAELTIGVSPDLEISSNSPICAGNTLSLNASYINGATYEWQHNGIAIIGNANTQTINGASVSYAGRYTVKVIINTSNCSNKLAEHIVQVDAPLNTGSISADTTVCFENNSGQVTITGYSSEIEKWEYREGAAGMWQDKFIHDTVFPYGSLTTEHSFRALVSSGACGSGYSNEHIVTVDDATNAGILNKNAVVCLNHTGQLELTGYSGLITQWDSSANGKDWYIINHTNPEYQYNNINSTTYYRTRVKSGVCPELISDSILITVNQPTVGGIIENGKIVCKGRLDIDTLFLNNKTGNVLQWEFSQSPTGPWNVQNIQNNYFLYQGLNFNTYYRVLVNSPGCDSLYSQMDTVIVEGLPDAGDLTGTNEVCATANSGYIQLNNYTGKVVDWHRSLDDGVSWDSTNTIFDTLNYNNLSQTVHYRALVNTQHEVCIPDTSNIISISVSTPTRAGNLIPDTIVACIGSDIETLHLINYTGTIKRWESSLNGNAPWSTISVTSDSLEANGLLSSTYYRPIVQSGVCEELIPEFTYVQIDNKSVGGTITGSTEVCEAVNTGKLNIWGNTGDVLKWESYTDGPSWLTVPNSSKSEITYNSLIDTTDYRAIIKNGICPYDTSTIARITVNPLPDVTFTSHNANLGDPVNFQNNTTIPGGFVQSWHWDFGNQESSSSHNPVYTYSKEGTYKVKLTATSNKSCIDSASRSHIIFGLPDVNFSYNNVCMFRRMYFKNTSNSAANTSYIWNFGDGTQIQASDTSHYYSKAGTYTVTLKAFSSSGGVDSVQKSVVVYPRAYPNFKVDNICAGNTANFSNFTQSATPYLTYYWDFANGETDQRTDPQTTYIQEGNYTVKLKVITSDGCADSINKNILVFPVPKADFSVLDVPYQQASVFLNKSSISYSNLSYKWEFGDENTSDTVNPVYYYEAPGLYQVKLTATSDSNCINSTEKSVKIFDLPVVDFLFDNVCIGDSMIFTNKSTIPSGTLSFEWAFGDKQTSEAESPLHLYDFGGIYTVRLISISNNGARDTVWKDVKVFDLPYVNYSFSEVCDGFTTHFENLSAVSDGEIASILWDFGDRTNSVQENPDKDFLNPGVYAVNLKISSTNKCSNSYSQKVIVHHNPVADFSVDAVCHHRTAEFNNSSFINNDDRPYTLFYNWDFDDNKTTDDYEPTHRYVDAGGYQVRLVASTDVGCRDTIYRLAKVYPLPAANAGKDTVVEKGFPIFLEVSGGDFYEWTPTDGLSDPLSAQPEARPMETTTYIVRVSDNNQCTTFDTMTVIVEDAMKIIPSNILTPNNNGENDTWNIVNIDSYPDAKISIFDRWGKMVYETTEYYNNWQGVNTNGDILPDGTYYYIIILDREHGVVYKGAITILRDK